MTIRYILILIFFISCKRIEEKDNTFYDLVYKENTKDTIQNWNPFLYVKTGKFLFSQTTNGLLIKNTKDSVYKVELYTLTIKGWLKNDEINIIEKNWIQFHTNFKDYNFDGQKDIYIQSTVSNGYPLSYGNLIVINPKNKKLSWIKDARNLANMNPNPNLKLLISESIDWRPDLYVCTLKNKWENDRIIKLTQDCQPLSPAGNTR
jgi:hypothetical protein